MTDHIHIIAIPLPSAYYKVKVHLLNNTGPKLNYTTSYLQENVMMQSKSF